MAEHRSTPSDRGDSELLEAYFKGEVAALGELASRYEASLLGLARGLLGGRGDVACDAVQEAWMRVIRYGRSFDGRSSVKTWLYRITVNRCRDLRRRDARMQADAGSDARADEEACVPGRDVGSLHEAIGSLKPPKREVILLCYHGGLTHEQAADVLGIPLGTLKSRLHAALGELREGLAEEVVR